MQHTDDELVARCQEELPYRTDAFEQLLQRYEPVVFNTCRRYLRSIEDAEEASQDALLRVFHALHKFRREASFKSWLFRIVSNVCATHYARLKVGRERLPRDTGATVEEVAVQPQAEYLEISGPLGADGAQSVRGRGVSGGAAVGRCLQIFPSGNPKRDKIAIFPLKKAIWKKISPSCDFLVPSVGQQL